jgi:succinate-semialdehyde dehydrogenase/glutarate-semialdehyde dehydrogenase
VQVVTMGFPRRTASCERFDTRRVPAQVRPQMLCAREEIFGPLVPVFRFKPEGQAIERPNAPEFGLASHF